MKKIILFLLTTCFFLCSPPVQLQVSAQRPGTEFAPEKQKRRKKATVPDNPERQEQKQKDSQSGDNLSKSDNKVEPGESAQEHRGRRWWRNFFKTKKKEYKEHHERIQTEEVRKRMKDNKKHSKKINKNKKPPRKIRNTTRKK